MNTDLLNLFIDESCTYYIGEPRFRFFILAGVVLDKEQSALVDILMRQWRRKYLSNPNKCFHSADFFQNTLHYAKSELSLPHNFKKAVNDLVTVIESVQPKVCVYYADLASLRNRLRVLNPPEFLPTPERTPEYHKSRQIYRDRVAKTLKDTQFCALPMTLNRVLEFHKSNLQQDPSVKGYINFESLASADKHFIGICHKHNDTKIGDTSYKYGERIIGINFHTKGSLSGGIELADIIAYITCQNLRSKHHCGKELKDIPANRLADIRKLRDTFRDKFGILAEDVSGDRVLSL